MRYRSVMVSVLTTLLSVASAGGQTTSATIRGRVLDPQGAPVAKVAVTVTGLGNGLARTVSTDAEGAFDEAFRACHVPLHDEDCGLDRIDIQRLFQILQPG